jgi:uncharacterized protein with PIN domain
MRFLVDASLPRSAVVVLREMGHDAVVCATSGLRSTTDDVIAAHARRNQQTLVTRDFDFADIPNYPPADYAGIIVLQLPDEARAEWVVKLLETFARRNDWLARLSGRWAIVEVWRVRFRPA